MFVKTIVEWYGKSLEEWRIILDTDGTVIFVVRTKNGHIDIVRVFSMGDTYQISIDFKELICRSYIDDITLFSIKLLELGKDFK